jgi:sugar phosphate isomerase/epimerase
MNPKISIGSWAFAFGPFAKAPWDFARIMKYAHEAGYDGVEINGFLPHPTPENYTTKSQRKQLLTDIKAHGLGVSGYAPDFSKLPPAIVEPESYLKQFQSYLAFAQDLETKIIRVDTVSPPDSLSEQDYSERFDRLANTWRASAELAEQQGMKVVWEFEPGFWLNKPSEVKRLVAEVAHPAFQVLFDTSHAYMSGVIGARQKGNRETLPGGLIEYAELLEEHIGHFHLIDSDGTLHDDETSTHAEFGAGKIDFKSVLTAMKPIISPMEWWCVDFCFNAEVEAWGRKAVPFIRETIREVN